MNEAELHESCHWMDHGAIDNAIDEWHERFTHVCGKTVYTLAAIELLNSINSC